MARESKVESSKKGQNSGAQGAVSGTVRKKKKKIKKYKGKMPFSSSEISTHDDLAVVMNTKRYGGASTRPHFLMTTPPSPFITGSDTSVGTCISLDCEFVGSSSKGRVSMLGRCALVNHHGCVLYDTFVAPIAPITDYRTRWSGIRKYNLKGAPDFVTVQSHVRNLLRGRTLVGHDVNHDLKVLNITHPLKNTRDTSRYTFNPFKKNNKGRLSKLKTQFKNVTDLDIQHGEHSPVEDAQAAMMLYQGSKDKWEASLLPP